MHEFTMEMRKTILQMGYWALFVYVSAYVSGQVERIPGFVIGIVTSATYFLLMCYRIQRSASMPVARAVTYMRTGWIIRLFFILLMLYLSVKLPWIDFWAAVIGLFSLYAVLVFNAFTSLITGRNPKRKG